MTRMEDECAQELLEVVPSVMRFIRAEMRRHQSLALSVPQFRALLFVERAGGASLGDVAEHLGLTPPSVCRLVDGLQGRGLLTRRQSPEDRRRLALQITPEGRRGLAEARKETRRRLSEVLASVDPDELAGITRSMSALRGAFSAPASPQRKRVVNAAS